jgi:hypothetical protein
MLLEESGPLTVELPMLTVEPPELLLGGSSTAVVLLKLLPLLPLPLLPSSRWRPRLLLLLLLNERSRSDSTSVELTAASAEATLLTALSPLAEKRSCQEPTAAAAAAAAAATEGNNQQPHVSPSNCDHQLMWGTTMYCAQLWSSSCTRHSTNDETFSGTKEHQRYPRHQELTRCVDKHQQHQPQ